MESSSNHIQRWAGEQSFTPSHLSFSYLLKRVPSSSLLQLIPGLHKWVCKHWEVGLFFKDCQQISPFLPQSDISIHADTIPELPTHLLSPGQPSPGHQEGKLLPGPSEHCSCGNRPNQIFPLLMLHLGSYTTFPRHTGQVRSRLRGGEGTPKHPKSSDP